MPWSDLKNFAPHTKSVFESLSQQSESPVLDVIPMYLNIQDHRLDSNAWAIELDRADLHTGVCNREVLLRYVLSRAIVDQGSDIEGVEMWHSRLFERCYKNDIRLLHNTADFVSNYAKVLTMCVEVRDQVVHERAQVWADQKKARLEIKTLTRYLMLMVNGAGNRHIGL